jgi:integrase
MRKQSLSLTAKRIEKLVSPTQGTLGEHKDGQTRGLLLMVQRFADKDRPPSASWLLRYQRFGKEHKLGLGSLNDFDLDAARERARLARQQIADGVDLIELRKEARAAKKLEAASVLTFEDACQRYYDQNQSKWTSKIHKAQFLATLKQHAYPTLGKLPVQDIDTPLVIKTLELIWEKTPETASRLRGRIENVLGWCTVRGYRTGDNPARWKGHLSEVLPAPTKVRKVQNHPAMPYAQLPAFMIELRKREGIASRALEFTILTAARTGEVIGATRSEIDFKNKVWTIPASRMKAGREHRVPLSDRAVKLLKALPYEEDNPFLFVGMRPRTGLSNMAMAMLLQERMGRDDVTVHGFRSSFRDWAAEETATPNHVLELALAHIIENKAEAAYRRGDLLEKRRPLMAAWAAYIG